MRQKPNRWVLGGLLVGGAVCIRMAWDYRADVRARLANNQNFVVIAPNPAGWLRLRPGPMTVSFYVHPSSGVTMRCARNESVASVRTEPLLNSDVLAEHFVTLTRERLPGWTAVLAPAIVGPFIVAPVADRSAPDRRVLNAFVVRGNSTYVFTLCGVGSAKDRVQEHIPQFRSWVAAARLERVTR